MRCMNFVVRVGILSSFVGVLSSANAQISQSEIFQDWNASGSGCQGGRSQKSDNVSLQISTSDDTKMNAWRLRFNLNRMKLTSPVPPEEGKTRLEFGRECDIRIALFPGAKKRLKSLSAYTRVSATKDDGVTLQLKFDLTVGVATVAQKTFKFEKSDILKNFNEAIQLNPARLESFGLPEMKCGAPKILGVDSIYQVSRTSEQNKAQIDMGSDKYVDFFVELENCEN